MSARRLLVASLLTLGCRGGEADDDSTPDPSGPSDPTDEIGESSSTSTDASSASTDESSASTDESSASTDESSASTDEATSDTEAPPEFAFGAQQTSNVFAFIDLQLADLDGDGCADLALSGTGAPPRLNLYVGACDGSFPGPAITRELTSFDAFVLGDLDGDARADVIAQGSGVPPRLEVYRIGDGLTLAPAVTSEVWAFDRLWAGDVDGEGRAELLTHQSSGLVPTVFGWSGPGDGSLVAQASSEVVGFEFAALGRVDLDARADLVIGSVSLGSQVSRWTGQADGSIAQAGPSQNLAEIGQIALGDLDGDGRDELLANVPGNDWVVQLYANLGDAFAEQGQLFAAVGYIALRSADLDGDGRDDLIVAPAGQPPRVTTWLSQ